MSGPHVFFASSPRHVLIAAGVALSDAVEGDAHLYFIEHIPRADVEEWLEILAGWSESPFRSVTRLGGDWRAALGDGGTLPRFVAKRLVKSRLRRANRALLADDFSKLTPEKVWVGCDTYYESQLALSFAKRHRPGARGAYLEDGTAAYARTFREGRLSRLLRLKRVGDLAKRLTYGSWWRGVRVQGTSPWIDEAWLAFPELAIADLAGKELHTLAPEAFSGAAFRGFAERAARAFGADPEALASTSLILVATRSTVARYVPGYVESMRLLVSELVDSGVRVAVKLHPREPEPDFLSFRGQVGVDIVPGALPFELLLRLVRDPEPFVIGDISSALLSARWLRPDARVIALRSAPEGSPAGRYLEHELTELGIPIARDPCAVAAQCSASLGSGELLPRAPAALVASERGDATLASSPPTPSDSRGTP